jgi:hypothetical protein
MSRSEPQSQWGVINFGNTENEVGVVKNMNGGGNRDNDQDQVDDAIEDVTGTSDSLIVKLEFGGRDNSYFLNGDGKLTDGWIRVLGDIQRAVSEGVETDNTDSNTDDNLPKIKFVNGGIEVSGGSTLTLNSGVTGLGTITAQNINPRVQVKVKCTALIRPRKGCKIICRRGQQLVFSRRCPRN